jgi:hypothetical protein
MNTLNNSILRYIIGEAVSQGWRLEHLRKSFCLYSPNGVDRVTISCTPSDKNVIHEVRRLLRARGVTFSKYPEWNKKTV